MEFVKYNSLENSYRIGFIEKIINQGKNRGEFVVQEKVHGSNFSIWFNGTDFKCARKTDFLEEGEMFFNFDKILEKYKKEIKVIFNKINNSKNIDTIAFFGELFGGNYDHKDVKPIKNASKVQKGILYHPDNMFMLFDVKINGAYLNEDELEELVKGTSFYKAKVLFRGTLEECLKQPNEFITNIPKDFGLPDVDGNICEGVVIKPVIPDFLYGGNRVIIKNKNDKWSEKAKAPKRDRKVQTIFSPEVQMQIDNMELFVTENRLRNVLSKIGNVTEKDFGKILGLFNKDVIEDYMKEYDEELNVLVKEDRKKVTNAINNKSANLIRPNFLNIIDGNF